MHALIWTFVFLLGLHVGSFLNAVIYRLALAEGLVSQMRDRGLRVPVSPFRGRSYCPQCGHQLSWQDLIPLVSFALLRGRCRYCKEKISMQYPVVEISTAAIFLLILNFEFLIFNQFLILQFSKLVYLFVIASLLIVLLVYDLRHYILPDKVLLPAIGIAALYQMSVFVIGHWDWGFWISAPLIQSLLAALGVSGFFFLIFLASRGAAMGFGDVKLTFFMGLFLGFPHIFFALFVAFVGGGIMGIGLIALRKKGLKSEVPFGPFLITGTFAALFWGDLLIQWYKGLAGF